MIFTTSSKRIQGKQNTIIQRGKGLFYPSLPPPPTASSPLWSTHIPHLHPPCPRHSLEKVFYDSGGFPQGFIRASMRKWVWKCSRRYSLGWVRISFPGDRSGLPSWELRSGEETRTGEGGCGEREDQRPTSSAPSQPSPCQPWAVLQPWYSHLPRSRALGCRRIRAGHCHTAARSAALRKGEFAEGACEDLGSMRLSAAFPDAPRSLPPGLQAPLHHGVCSAEASALSLSSFTDNPYLLWEELLRGGSGLLGTEGFLGSGWPITLTETEPAMCPKGSGSLLLHIKLKGQGHWLLCCCALSRFVSHHKCRHDAGKGGALSAPGAVAKLSDVLSLPGPCPQMRAGEVAPRTPCLTPRRTPGLSVVFLPSLSAL